MVLSKFSGIQQYHDGSTVSDYTNVIPLGTSAIDRLGEELLQSGVGSPRGSFVDSLGNIYVVVGAHVYRYVYDGTAITTVRLMQGRIGSTVVDGFTLRTTDGKVTFCEASVKPTQVYMCDGTYIYQWNTTDYTYDLDTAPWLAAFVIRMMITPNILPLEYDSDDAALRAKLDDIDLYAVYEGLDGYTDLLDISEAAVITSITWFDNKLVAVQQDKNTVWLTATDPNQFFRYSSSSTTDDDGNEYYLPYKSQWLEETSGDTTTLDTQFWWSWYSSTDSAARLNTAIGFAGQLWLLNETTIEPWSRTGDEDAPLSANSLSVIYHGGRSPLIIDDVMYLICRDQIGNEFVGAINSDGFTHISNSEVEKRFDKNIAELVPMTVRETTFVLARTSDSRGVATGTCYCFSTNGYWWKWENPVLTSEFAIWSLVKDLALSNHGSILRFTAASRTLCDGTVITRSIRDFFMHFTGRKICRSVELIMDAGIAYYNTEPTEQDRARAVYCRTSFDRGHSFGPLHYRKLGRRGDNDFTVIWHNLGSGNSLLLEFGTSANYQFQIYQIDLEIA